MGAGRKKAAYHPEPPTQGRTITQWCGDQSAFARNLGEDELAGVIFGCTNQTINECLSKQLFGLPAGHFSYVKNIKPGLPLFLFNYSDRKLHGVFEAATSGQLSIDQFAWSHDGRTKTQYPAQKLQGLYLLQQENAQSSKAVVDSTSDKSTPQESQLGTTFPKDPSNATLEGDAPVKDDTSFKQRCGNDELLQMFNELLKHTKAMGKKQIESDQEILLLKKSVKNVEKNVQKLQYQYEKLQLEYSAALLGETRNNLEGPSIFLIGGHNGITLLSSLDSFNPTTDRLEPLRPMSSARSYAAVAALKEHVFVFGGGDGITSWYNTVECYNRGSNEWVTCPRLKRKKGSLAGATLDDKIFAIGGGDGSQSFSEVEMFDLARGCWIYSRSMQQCRFTPGAAELNGILYVVGGYDYNSNTYLESAERYDPREGFWTQLASMRAKRGCHSLAVLGEDLYALGGHNGDSMVSTVEIFDPRANLWRINSPFSIPRGYGCAVTANDNLYLIGGIDTSGENVGTVEVYNMRQGWWIPGYKAIGMRSFASAIAV